MSGNPSVAGKNVMLNGLSAVALYASMHTADPGSTGASEATGGSPAYARKAVSWSAASAGSLTTSAIIIFDLPAGTYTHLGLWSAATAGTYYYKILLPTAQVLSSQSTLAINSVTIDQSLVSSA